MLRTLLLLGVALVLLACGPRAPRTDGSVAGGVRVLTIAHFSLQTGFRNGFGAVVRAYEARNPGVKIEILEVPGTVWSNWLMTKLVGQMAPDVIQIALPSGGSVSQEAYQEMLGRYFLPFRAEMRAPNPYAAGTRYAEMPWRQTFVDGLAWPPSYSLTNFEVYGVPFTLFTHRLVYNRDLMREVTGSDEPPKDFRAFLRVCEAVHAYKRRTGRAVVPIAAARNTGPELMSSFFGSVTQWLRIETDPHHQFALYPTDLLRAAIGGNFDFDRKEVRAGLELARLVGLQCTPGFMQLQRDSAVFHFGQGRALMMLSNPADMSTLRNEAGFPIGIFPIPWPTVDDPEYGRYVMGPLNENQGGLQNSFGIAQTCVHPEIAVDFLQFATSPEGAALFARTSGLLPAVVVADVEGEVAAFKPIDGGYPPGLPLGWGRPEIARVFDHHLHHLLSPAGSVDAFIAAMQAELPAANIAAANGFQRNWLRSIRQRDGALAAYAWLMDHASGESERTTAAERWSVTLDNDSQADAHLYMLDAFLVDPGPLPRHPAPPVGARRRAER